MKRFPLRVLALLLAACLILSGCSGTSAAIGRMTNNLQSYKFMQAALKSLRSQAKDDLRPQAVGTGLEVMPMAHFPEGFKSKYPIAGDGVWDGAVKPLFDPLGGQSAYNDVRTYYTDEYRFTYLDADYREVSRQIAGDYWRYDFIADFEDFRHLEKYATDLGGEILSVTGAQIAFVIKQDGWWWWGQFFEDGQSEGRIKIRAELWREMRVAVGQTLKITTGMGDGDTLYFTTTHTDGKMQSLRVQPPERHTRFAARSSYKRGDFSKEVFYGEKNLETASAPDGVFILDDIPQQPGDLIWTVQTGEYWIPQGQSLSLTLTDVMDIPPVKMGEGPGALLVKGAPWGSVKVILNGNGYKTSHPALSGGKAVASQTGEGDTLIWLPTGYWDVTIMGQWNRMVPISEGELTVLTAPTNLRRNESEDEAAQAAAGERSIEERGLSFLSGARESGETVSMDFLLFDSASRNPQLKKDDMRITENSLDSEILSIEPLNLPPNVVLVLDSSGSMEGELEATLDAARAFIRGLPDDATIQLVDFDATVKPFAGTTKAEALQNIDKITLGGSTALYGATVQGLQMLAGKERATLILFTDGKNEPAAGGLTDKAVVVDAIAKSGVPVYTIGFGPEHAPPPVPEPDPNAGPDAPVPEVEVKQSDIRDFAMLSDGKYYSAADQDALSKVFDAIAARIGNAFTVTYRRPRESSLPDVPVVMLIIDNSSSMGYKLENGTRLETVKAMYRQFLLDAPENTIMQAMDFYAMNFQMLTTDKASMLAALAALHYGGGTEIIGTSKEGYKSLMDVATSKRILIYVTDEAMIDPARDETYAKVLEKFKESGISTLWVGMVDDADHYMEIYKNVAEYSGGSYVISKDSNTLSDGLKKMLDAMYAPPSGDKSQIALQVLLGETGAKRGFSGNLQANLKALPTAPTTSAPPEALKLASGLPLEGLFAQKKPAEPEKEESAEENPKIVPLSSQHGAETAQKLTGSSPSTDTQILNRAPLGASGKSEGLEIRATDLYRITKLRGITPPEGMTYMAVGLEIKNLFGDRPFQIPTIKSHFYIELNDTDSYPASICTWLAETPLTVPGDYAVQIPAGETKTGMLYFLVGDQDVDALRLSFYDTVHGHILMPLMGSPKDTELSLEKLPASAPAKLSDSFSISITGFSDVVRIGSRPAPAGMIYRIVEGRIDSNVQALLDLRPGERLFMDISSGSGVFRLPISPITDAVPMGYLSPKMLAPGSSNTFRWVFEVPEPLASSKTEIYGDIYGGAIHIPVKDGPAYSAGQKLGSYSGEYVDLTVNELGLLSKKEYDELVKLFETTAEQKAEAERVTEEKRKAEEERLAEEGVEEHIRPEDAPASEENPQTQNYEGTFYVVADVTITDKDDGYGTSNLHSSIAMVSERITPGSHPGSVLVDGVEKKGLGNFSSDEFLSPQDSLTGRLALGIDNTFVVHDGESRRGLMVFKMSNKDFYLGSEYFPDMRLSIPTKPYTGAALMRPKAQPEKGDYEFANALDTEIKRVVEQYRAAHPAAAAAANKPSAEFSIAMSPGTAEVPSPSPALYGAEQLVVPRTPEEVLSLLQGLAWRPSYLVKENLWTARFAPEAVLTQGWGTEFDLAVLAEHLLSRAGLNPERVEVTLTEGGRQALRDYLKIVPSEKTAVQEGEKKEPLPFSDKNTLPALFYRDGSGEAHLLVIPFMRDLAELEGYAYLPGIIEDRPKTEYPEVTVKVTVEAIPISEEAKADQSEAALDVGGLFGSLSGSVSGDEKMDDETGTTEITVLEESFLLTDLSMSAVDVGFAVGDDRAWVAWVDTPLGRKPGNRAIEKKDYQPVKIIYTVSIEKERYIHEVLLNEGQTPDGVFCTLGINLPELHGDGFAELNETVRAYPGDQNPDDISALRWYARNNLYRFIGQQTTAEDMLAKQMDLVVGRSSKTRCIAVTVQKQADEEKLSVSFDLMSAFNQIHSGQDEASAAFNIMSGLTVSKLEGAALGTGGVDYDVIWSKAPKGTNVYLITPDTLKDNVTILRSAGYPEPMLARMERSIEERRERMYLINDNPSKIGDAERWAMLEIDCETYETISVLDDGGNSSMVEFLITHMKGNDPMDYVGYAFGAMVGASVGIGSLCTASLVTDDYAEAVEIAVLIAGDVLEGVNRFFDLTGASNTLVGLGGKSGSGGAGPVSAEGKLGDTGYDDGYGGQNELKFSLGMGGPAAGFKKGLEYYFSQL